MQAGAKHHDDCELSHVILINGRDFVPRRDVRRMECKHGLPMAEIKSLWAVSFGGESTR